VFYTAWLAALLIKVTGNDPVENKRSFQESDKKEIFYLGRRDCELTSLPV